LSAIDLHTNPKFVGPSTGTDPNVLHTGASILDGAAGVNDGTIGCSRRQRRHESVSAENAISEALERIGALRQLIAMPQPAPAI
jgi:hypothetical protein